MYPPLTSAGTRQATISGSNELDSAHGLFVVLPGGDGNGEVLRGGVLPGVHCLIPAAMFGRGACMWMGESEKEGWVLVSSSLDPMKGKGGRQGENWVLANPGSVLLTY
jgi:hypothetical protein